MSFPFPTATEEVTLAGSTFRMLHASDLEILWNHLLTKPADHVDIKDERIPYWAEVWPSALALSRYLLENPALITDKRILEIGCGLGLPGIVAGTWADRVTLTDYLPEALQLAAYNWKINHGTEPLIECYDWRNGETIIEADVVLASDVAYERRMFDPLRETIKRYLERGARVIISEPDRALAREFFTSWQTSGYRLTTQMIPITRASVDYRVNIHRLEK